MSFDVGRIMAMRDTILGSNSALHRASARGPYAGSIDGAAVPGSAGAATLATAAEPFSHALQAAVQDVNAASGQATAMSDAYERGDITDIASVMLARQQASIGFEATLQVRNKLLSAYKDIMSMPV